MSDAEAPRHAGVKQTISADQDGDVVNGRRPTQGNRHVEPQTLHRSLGETLLLVGADILSIVLWSGLLVYIIILWTLRGKTVSEIPFDANRLAEAARPLSTIYTILFAATIGRNVRSLALWRLEQGSTVGLLDRLLGSTTVGGTLVANIMAGFPSSILITSLIAALIVLWGLSPLGSQALLRIVSFAPQTSYVSLERHYLNTTRWQSLPGAGSTGQLDLIPANALLNAAIISSLSSKALPTDLWGNFKIPRFEELEQTRAEAEGWIGVENVKYSSYSALIGIPIGELPNSGSNSSNVTVESWYWNLDCDSWHNSTSEKVNYTTWFAQYDTNFSSALYPSTQAVNIFMNLSSLNRTEEFCSSPCAAGMDVHYCSGLPARELGFMLRDDEDFYLNKCRINTTQVESELLCENGSCHASRVRASRLPNIAPANWSVLDLCVNRTSGAYYNFNNPLYRFALNLADAIVGRLGGSGGSNVFAGYISTPENPLPTAYLQGNGQNILSATDDAITNGLAQILNTYWIANLAGGLISGGGADDFKLIDPYEDSLDGSAANTSLLSSSIATVAMEENKLVCDVVWLTILTVSTIIVLTCAIGGLVLVLLTRGPRLAFNISTLLRDNPYVDLPSQGSYLNDDERSRLNSRSIIMMGNVEPHKDVGHIALSSVGPGVRRLERQQLYD